MNNNISSQCTEASIFVP